MTFFLSASFLFFFFFFDSVGSFSGAIPTQGKKERQRRMTEGSRGRKTEGEKEGRRV